jgi:hypothetical protein
MEGSDILLKVILLCSCIPQVEKCILFDETVIKGFESRAFFVVVSK